MKKTLLLLFFLLTCFVKTNMAQNAYYDAMELRNLIDNATNKVNTKPDSLKKAAGILYHYLKLSSTQTPAAMNYQAVQTLIATSSSANYNPILSKYLSIPGSGITPALTGATGGGGNTVGNLNVANAADGVAQFLIERGKQELDIKFIADFQAFIKKYPELSIVFPATTGFVTKVSSYNYAMMMPALRAAFQKDLNSLSTDLLNLRSTSNYTNYATDPNVKLRADVISKFLNTDIGGRVVTGGLIVAAGLNKGTNAATIIDMIADDQICTPDDIFSNSIKFASLLSGSLRSEDKGRTWITRDQVAMLFKDNETFNIFIGLLYSQNQKTYHIDFKINTTNTITLQTFLTDVNAAWTDATKLAAFKQTFSDAANAASDITDNGLSINKMAGSQPSYLIYADYATSVATFLKATVNLLPANSNITPQATKIAADVQYFCTVISSVADEYYYLKSQNYGALVLSISPLVGELLASSTYTFDKMNTNNFIKYTTFMAGVAEAKSSNDVNAAIEAAALPAGSYSIKQRSKFNISLNGYIGYAWDVHSGNGISAPIGFSGTFGTWHKYGIPVTFFVGIIDVGAFVKYRLNDTTTNSFKQQITLESIVTPSAQLFFEIPNWPVAVGAGWRMTPKLFFTANNSNFVTVPSKSVFNISVLIDIPIFTLHNVSY